MEHFYVRSAEMDFKREAYVYTYGIAVLLNFFFSLEKILQILWAEGECRSPLSGNMNETYCSSTHCISSVQKSLKWKFHSKADKCRQWSTFISIEILSSLILERNLLQWILRSAFALLNFKMNCGQSIHCWSSISMILCIGLLKFKVFIGERRDNYGRFIDFRVYNVNFRVYIQRWYTIVDEHILRLRVALYIRIISEYEKLMYIYQIWLIQWSQCRSSIYNYNY